MSAWLQPGASSVRIYCDKPKCEREAYTCFELRGAVDGFTLFAPLPPGWSRACDGSYTCPECIKADRLARIAGAR